jgi:hypothetical protein
MTDVSRLLDFSFYMQYIFTNASHKIWMNPASIYYLRSQVPCIKYAASHAGSPTSSGVWLAEHRWREHQDLLTFNSGLAQTPEDFL